MICSLVEIMKREIKIDHDVPMPSHRTQGIMSAMRSMKIGDSFVAPVTALSTNLYLYAKRAGIKISIRAIGDKFRIWRVQ